MTEHDILANVCAIAERIGLTMKAEPIQHRPGGDDPEWQDTAAHFRITLATGGGRGEEFYYSMGVGHRRWKKGARGLLAADLPHQAHDMLRARKAPADLMRPKWYPGPRAKVVEFIRKHSEADPPSLADVIHSLVLDSDLGRESFREFCAELGYDEDSRKALASWEACRDTFCRLSRMIGSPEMAELAEAVREL